MIIDTQTPWAFFNGASKGAPLKGGVGGVLYLTRNHTVSFKADNGQSLNNQSELTALKLVLLLAIEKGITRLQVLGYSLLVIQWVNGDAELRNFCYSPSFEMSNNRSLPLLTSLLLMFTGKITRKLIGYPRTVSNYKKEIGRSKSPNRDTFQRIFTNPVFRILSVSEMNF